MISVNRNVAIIFENALMDDFIKMSHSVGEKVTSKINLNHKNEIPHLSLYISTYPEKNIGLVINKLDEIAKITEPFKLKLKSKSCHLTGTIFIDAVLTDELYKLHTRLVDTRNPIREGLYNEEDFNLPGMTEKGRKSLKKFGMWAVKEAYTPHVSVGRVTNLTDCETAIRALPEVINYETIVETIALVETGHDGTCKEILKKFKLNN